MIFILSALSSSFFGIYYPINLNSILGNLRFFRSRIYQVISRNYDKLIVELHLLLAFFCNDFFMSFYFESCCYYKSKLAILAAKLLGYCSNLFHSIKLFACFFCFFGRITPFLYLSLKCVFASSLFLFVCVCVCVGVCVCLFVCLFCLFS